MSYNSFTILWGSLLVVLLAGYFAQQYLPPPTPRLVGIDLGTTYSCVGVYEAVTGKVSIIPTSNGHKTIPSVVHFSDNGTSVGYNAFYQAKKDPANMIYDAKRFIGKFYTSDELSQVADHYPFQMILEDGNVKFKIGSPQNTVIVTPELVGSRIIDVLKKSAEYNLSVPIEKAVMAVPVEFDEQQRNATKTAAKLAGLEVLRIINEPTAAALAYGLHKMENVQNVMVVDIGGGTSDVSILNVQHGMFLTRAIAGNNYLGGQDFNRRLLEYFLDVIYNKTRKTPTPEETHSLQQGVEEVKLNLTNADFTLVSIAFPSLNFTLRYNVTRRTFEDINDDLFKKIVQLLDTVLQEAEMQPEDIDEVVLVGGSTRIPKVRQIIGDYFGKPPNMNLDPELAVAHGVAIQAGIIGGMWPLQVSAIELPSKLKKIHVQ